jgi:hypothetical protein
VVGGFILLGFSRLKLNVKGLLDGIAAAVGVDPAQIAFYIAIAAAVILFVIGSVWYCTANFPVENFRRYLKFMFNFVVPAVLITMGFINSPSFAAYLESRDVNDAYYIIFFSNRCRDLALRVVIMVILGYFSCRIKILKDITGEVTHAYDSLLGSQRVQPVQAFCSRRTPADVRRISNEFTRKELEKLKEHVSSLDKSELSQRLSFEAYNKLMNSSSGWINTSYAKGYFGLIIVLVAAYLIACKLNI